MGAMRWWPAAAAGFLVIGTAWAQESPSFSLEGTFNAGGHPRAGATLTSASFRITLDSLGQGVTAPALTGASFTMEGGIVSPYLPPGEVTGLRFTAHDLLVWDPDRSAGDYAVYRGTLTRPFDPAYGSCVLPRPVTNGAMDTTTPLPGEALFYLVTARNRLREEGTKGTDSDDNERVNAAPCP